MILGGLFLCAFRRTHTVTVHPYRRLRNVGSRPIWINYKLVAADGIFVTVFILYEIRVIETIWQYF